jgi:hypothetical protein
MIDSVSIVAIIAGCSALIVAVLTHIKHSTCKNGSFEITTTESHTPQTKTPEEHFNFGNMIESITQDLENPARKDSEKQDLEKQDLENPARKVSDPIPIPKVEIKKKNYL